MGYIWRGDTPYGVHLGVYLLGRAPICSIQGLYLGGQLHSIDMSAPTTKVTSHDVPSVVRGDIAGKVYCPCCPTDTTTSIPLGEVLACRHASKVVNIEDTDIVSLVSTTSTASLRAVQVLATPALKDIVTSTSRSMAYYGGDVPAGTASKVRY